MTELVQEGTLVAILFLIGTLTMKISAIVIGYLIVRLGHDTLVRGITGELDFGFSGSGVEAKLKSASPGAAFVLAGAAIIIWALALAPMGMVSALRETSVLFAAVISTFIL